SLLKKIEKRENENPNQINEVPEKAGDFYAIGEVFGIVSIKPEAGRKQHVTKDQHATKDVRAVQTSDREVTREIRAVFRQGHVCVLQLLLVDGRDFVRGSQRPEMRPIHRRIGRISVNRIERDLVLFDIGIFQGFFVVKVPGNFRTRREALLEQVPVAE